MSGLLIVLTVALILVVIIQISKASEYVSLLKGKEKALEQSNKINGALMIVFLLVGLIGVYICHEVLKDKLLPVAASDAGVAIDKLIWWSGVVTAFVFFLTQILLFYFAFRYQAKPGRKAKYYPVNYKLEVTWTSLTIVVLIVLTIFGLKVWYRITGPAPKDSMVVEVTGKQFNWIFRYPGKDDVLGAQDYQLIDPAKSNPLGQDWSDNANKDDIVSNEFHLVVDKPVKLIIQSQDVIHDVGLPYFRLKMDALPGQPTTLWFTPTITTEQMKKKTGDPDFVYELACDQLCGNGHYSMRAVIVVETQAEFDKWAASVEPQYKTALSSEAPAANSSASAADPLQEKDGVKPVAMK